MALAACHGLSGANQGAGNALAPLALHHGDDELWLAAFDEPQSIDPALSNDTSGAEAIVNLFSGLVDRSADGTGVLPDLATSWSVSADGRTYTFALRQSAWSDGTPVTAEDFVYSIARALRPETGCRFASMLYLIEGAKERHLGGGDSTAPAKKFGVEALNAHTLRITLVAPTPYFLSFLCHSLFRPVPRHVLHKLSASGIDPALWTRPEHIVSNGAYRLQAWRFKRDYTLERNEHYWGAKMVRLRRIRVTVVQSPGTVINLYRAGAIDWTGPSTALPASYVAALRELPDFYSEPSLSVYFYWFNTRRAPTDDVRVRKALSLSVDRRALVERVLRGGQQPTASLVPPNLCAYPAAADARGQNMSLDVSEAQRLLQDAGYGPHNPLPTLTLIYNTAESHKLVAEALQAMWHQHLGITVALENQEWRVHQERLMRGDFDLARMGWVGDFPDAFSFLQDVLTEASGNDHGHYDDATFNDLLHQSTVEPDVKKRQLLLHDAEARALKAAPLMPLFVSAPAGLRHPALMGLTPNMMNHHPYKNLYFEQRRAANEARR